MSLIKPAFTNKTDNHVEVLFLLDIIVWRWHIFTTMFSIKSLKLLLKTSLYVRYDNNSFYIKHKPNKNIGVNW